jgi:peptidoglycan hydrolase-like protein with peptidoglycan-binding domain
VQNQFFTKGENEMNMNRLVGAVVFGGALGLIVSPAWSQKKDNQSLPPITKEPSGTPPGAQPKGDLGLSHDQIREVQQALQEKGFNPGTSGVLDSKTRDALRLFQKNNNIPMTGSVDNETAEKLGVHWNNNSGSVGSKSGKTSDMR